MSDAFEITVHTGGVRQGWIEKPLEVHWTPRFNQTPTASVVLPGNHILAATMRTDPSCWLRIKRGGEEITGRFDWEWSGTSGKSTLTATVTGDFDQLRSMLAYPQPTSPVETQGNSYDHRTGSVETVLKAYVQANAGRFGYIDIAPDQGRGPTVNLQARMDTILDLTSPSFGQLGVSVTRQDNGRLLLDCYSPRTFSPALSERAGTLVDWKITRQRATATTVVGLGAGQMTNREFRSMSSAALEKAQSWRDEIAVDMRDLQVDESTTLMNTTAKVAAAMDSRMQQALADHAAKTGLSVTLAERGIFRYGTNGVRVGDLVTIEIPGGLDPANPSRELPPDTYTDVLTECQIDWTTDGLKVAPSVGDVLGDPDRDRAVAIRDLRQKIRQLQTRQ